MVEYWSGGKTFARWRGTAGVWGCWRGGLAEALAIEVVPNPPSGNTITPDVIFTAAGNITVSLATTNIPSGTPLTVRITAAGQVITAPHLTHSTKQPNLTATIHPPGLSKRMSTRR